MKMELLMKKCNKCGALVKVFKDCTCNNCGMICCEEKMEVIVPNSVDASVEKHIPNYEKAGDKIVVKVNHVMEDEHFIEWISLVSDKKECIKYLKPGMESEVQFNYVPGSVLYSYCNKHGLWKKEVD